MIIYKTSEMINIIKFKKITLYVDGESSIFLGNIKANEIGIYLLSDEILLNKFNVMNWDTVTNNLIHVKFLVKYSPILSKFIDLSEFNEIEFCNPDLSINKRYCLKINDKNMFSTRDLDYERIGVKMDPYLKELLMQEDSIQ